MKKSYLTLAAVAAVMASCSNEVLIDQVETPEVAIGFETFNDKLTKSENSGKPYDKDLSVYHENFAVWGYKNTEEAKVFNNQLVSYDASKTTDKWSYTPVRFWDKAATSYEFYAASPQTDENGVTVNWSFKGNEAIADQANHYFELSNVTLVGSNLSNTTTPTLTYETSFKSAPKVDEIQDIDYMIADKKSVPTTDFTTSPVQLNFIHILSRLNITVKHNLSDESTAVITLKSLEVVDLNNKANFDESIEAADESKKIARWKDRSGQYTINSIKDYTVTKDAKYILQSLIIPQETELQTIKLDGSDLGDTPKPYIKIVYTIDPDGTGDVPAEKFTVHYNLAKVFGVTGENKLAFNEGWQNTLNITIDPTEIKFAAKAALWDDDLTKDLTVIKND